MISSSVLEISGVNLESYKVRNYIILFANTEEMQVLFNFLDPEAESFTTPVVLQYGEAIS